MLWMDDKDRKILEVLNEDSSLTTRQIARKIRIPITTVHNRIRKLKEENIIKKYTIEMNHKLLGKNFPAIIMISFDYSILKEKKIDQHKIAKEINMMPEVEKVSIVTGDFDAIVQVRVKDVEDFDKFLLKKLQNVSGVGKTKSMIVIFDL